ncbi:MAG: DUF1700 domain-containing protein [Lachnospiraceae bacterium]|nr:DUF1700 domain-containing protein [Lachnospiraceae bacterium]
MNKSEFLAALREKLNGVPEEDINKSLDFYEEMIDDRVEDGMSEEEAVEALGSMEEIIAQILSEVSLPKLVKEKVKPKQSLKAWEIVLIVLGAPIWVPLVFSICSVVLSAYLTVWIMIISLYATDLAIALSGLALTTMAFVSLVQGNFAIFGMMFGCGLVLMGISILLFFGFNQVMKGILWLSKKILIGIKGLFIKK